jgi:pimeloyl-ACP methyl ester carboxylesterase
MGPSMLPPRVDGVRCDGGSVDTAVFKPFRIDVPQSQLDDLAIRLDLTRWPESLPDVGWSQGPPVAYLRELSSYWRHRYDWRVHEARLNGFDQYVTEIDGQRIHFMHVRSPRSDALPLVLTHGWPGSIIEFVDVIGPLSSVHDLVIPSLPGFGFSGPTTESGWDVNRIARAWAELMRRLGYDRYGAQGGDWGSRIACELIVVDPDHLAGAHLNMLFTSPPDNSNELSALSDEDRVRLDSRSRYARELSGYFKLQSTRPQTLAFALSDSPVGQLAWIVERFKDWTDSTGSPEEAVDRDHLLTNVMIYWLTGTAGSSARLYFESRRSWATRWTPSIPVGVAVYAHDLMLPVRALAEREYNVVHWSEFERGGHFAAMEVPDVFAADVLAFFSKVY